MDENTSTVLGIALGLLIIVLLIYLITRLWKLTIPRLDRFSSGLDDLFAVLVLGAIGVAAYRFIERGGLKKLMSDLGPQTINVHGQRTTIASAVDNYPEIQQLLRQALEKRLATLDEEEIEDVDSTSAEAATDVAQMLREAVSKRMRERGA